VKETFSQSTSSAFKVTPLPSMAVMAILAKSVSRRLVGAREIPLEVKTANRALTEDQVSCPVSTTLAIAVRPAISHDGYSPECLSSILVLQAP
jgi:hypothetical protein